MKTETIYAIIICAIAGIGAYFFAPGRELALADIILVKVVSVAVFLSVAFGLIYAMRGIQRNIMAEVFDEHNTAAAFFTGLVLVALAMVCK